MVDNQKKRASSSLVFDLVGFLKDWRCFEGEGF